MDIWKELQFQCLLGDRNFCERFVAGMRDRKELKEIPRAQRYAARPSLDELIPPEVLRSRPARKESISQAALEWGYSYAELSRHTSLHYTTISRIARVSKTGRG